MKARLQRWPFAPVAAFLTLVGARPGRCHGRGGHFYEDVTLSWGIRFADGMRSILSPAIAGTAAVLALAGCGGSAHKHTSPSQSAGAARSAFITRLDSLCNETNAAYQSARSVPAATKAVQQYMPRFRALAAPGDLASLYSRYTAVLEQELTDLEHGQQATVTHLAQTKARPLAAQLGAVACANPR